MSTVLLVDGSAAQRRFARAALEAGSFTVVGEARGCREALSLVERLHPETVLLDLGAVGSDALQAVEQIMAARPTPILVCAATGGDGPAQAASALAAGAVDVLARPDLEDRDSRAAAADALCAGVQLAARVRVIRHLRGRSRTPAVPDVPPGDDLRLLAVGTSTGGPEALRVVLSALPRDLRQAVVVVQHMAESFLPGLAAWLDSLVPLPVRVGDGSRLEPGTVTLAPGGCNLLVQDDRLRVLLVPPPAGQFHVPGVDATFGSIATALGAAAVGVVLTGMGRDGAQGLAAMRARGAVTFAQDEASSAVYGMPAAALAAGAASRQLPVDEIGPAVLALLRGAACPGTAR